MSYPHSGKNTPLYPDLNSAYVNGKFLEGDIFEVRTINANFNDQIGKWIYFPSTPATHNLFVLHCIRSGKDREHFIDLINELDVCDDIILRAEPLRR